MTTVADATTQLQQRYISSRFSFSVDEWPPYQPKHYTTLAFIHNKGKFTDAVRFFVAQELAVAGNINATKLSSHLNLNANMTRNISDIFLPVRASDVDLHILIEGAPGIGKTVLAKEIAYRWAGNELLTSKELLFLVFLRECFQKPVMTIEGLIQFVFKSSEMTSCLTKYLTKTQGKDTVIIFDGFDELSEENKKESIIVDIINRRILTKCCLVVTSRPTASSILHECIDRRVEIVGFTEEDRLDYIQTALRTHDKEVNNKHVKALQHYLQSNPTINALCYIPLNMTILLCLVEDGIDNLPKTQTKMYKKFIEITIVRFIKKYDKSNTIIDIAKLLDPYDKLFMELAKLAYEALKTDKIVFTLPEIKEGCPNLTLTSSNWNGLGLLKAVQCFSVQMGNDQVTFHFLHFSIQEYMAAWYISTLPSRKQIKLLQKTFWKHRYYNTWIMYVGITGGCNFSLRHFLSGNWFQLYSKLFRSSKVSDKFLKDKMKCLHLFQCLLEANKEDIIEPVKQLFQNKRIDLSNQTLLPSDLNTLGFFLIRSINRQWDELDLSSCNIGSNGTNILCDRLLDKDARGIVTIKVVKFSYNQLNFTSLIRLFDLFSSWHTSEIVITDDVTQDVKAIEDITLQSSSTLRLVLIGSYLFCKSTGSSRTLGVLLNTTNIRSIYLLNCSWLSSDNETIELLSMLEKQKLNKVRIIGSSLNETFIKTLASRLLYNYNSVNMFVYNPTMPDEIADDISRLITSSVKDISGVMLIVSSSKVQGIVNTCSLSNELSTLEIFNLNIYIRYLNTKMCPWREECLEGNNLNKEISFTFIKLLHKINFNWKLEIIFWENNTVIAHKAKFTSLNHFFKHFTNDKLVIYLSYCDIQYDVINKACSTLHILNSPECTELLSAKLLHKQFVPNELFIYGNLKYNLVNSLIELLSHDHLKISAVLAVNSIIVGIHPSNELIALAFQLQPFSTSWILSTTDNRSVFYQVLDAIAITPTVWIELDFTGCDIGDMDCEVVQRTFTYNNCSSTIKKLSISFNRLSVSGMQDLAKIVSISEVQELNINGTNDVLLDCLIKNLMRECQTGYFLSITYNHKILIMVCNTSWNEVALEMNTEASEIYIINCDLPSEILNYLHTVHNLLRLCIINGSASSTVILEIFEFFSKETIEILISNINIIDGAEVIRNFFTNGDFCLNEKLNVIVSIENYWLCVYNVTKYQLHLLYQYFMSQTPPIHYGMTLIRKLEQLSGNKIYVFDNNLVNSLFLDGNIRDSIMNATIEFTLHDGHKISVVLVANNVVAEIYPSSKQIAPAFHLQPLSTTWIHCTVVSANVFYQLIDMLAILHTKWTELDFTHCNIGDTECEIMHRNLKLNHSSTVRKLKISLIKLSASGIPDLVRIILIWKVQELHINGTNDLLYNYLVKKLASEHHNYSFLSITYNQKVIIWNADGNKIVTILNGLVSELLMINCNLSKELISYLNTTHNLLRLCLINGHVSVTTVIKILKSDKIGEVSISNARIIDDDDRIRNLVTQRKYYLGIKSSFMLSTSKWLCVYNITNYQLPLIQQYFINQVHSNCYGMSLVRKIEQINGDKMYVFDNSLLNVIRIYAKVPQAPGATQIIAAISNIVSLHTIEIDNYTITNETVDDLANILHHNTQLQELYWNGNCLQADDIIAKILHSISTASVCKNHITDDATSNFVATQTSTTSETNLEIANSTTAIKTMSLHSIATSTKFSISNDNITDKAAYHISGVIFNNTYLQELNLVCSDLQASGIIRVAGCLQKISSLTTLYINHNIITHKAADHIAAAISGNTKLQEIDISGNILQTAGVRIIMKALQGIHTLKILYLGNNVISSEAADDIAAAIHCNTKLQELDVSGNDLRTEGVTKIAVALQSIVTLTKLNISNNNITSTAANAIAVAITHNTHLQEFIISGNYFEALGATMIARSLQKISTLTKLCIANTSISDKAAYDIAAAVSCNIYLREFKIGRNNLQALGATRIARGLQKISSLRKFYINNNKITYEAADDIATAIQCSSQLCELDVSNNKFQTQGIRKIVKSLQGSPTLIKLDISNNHVTDEAADDIATAISCNTGLQELNINGNDFKSSGAIIIAKSLQKVSTLTKLYMDSNNITDGAADDISAAISFNPCLKEFTIARNNLQTLGAMKIAKGLQNITTLEKLHIDINNITQDAADNIAAAISYNTQLEELDVSGNYLRTEGVEKIVIALQRIVTLTKLNISNNNVTYTAANAIAVAITHNTHLQEIIISGNGLGVLGAKMIARSLQKNLTLIKLIINNNNITDEAADDIAAAIHCNTKLQELDVSGNDLRTEGVIKIAVALQSIVTLTKLNISNNNITCTAANAIAVAITHNTHLQEFIISGNGLGVLGAKVIARSLQKISTLTKLYMNNNKITDEAADDIATAISCNTGLQELNINGNDFKSSGAIIIAKSLQKVSILTKLYMDSNNITDEAADDISAAISCNPCLKEFTIARNNLQTLGVMKIAKGLQNITALAKLHMHVNNITQDVADDIAAAISCNSQLEELDISRNDLQEMGVIKIAIVLQSICTLKNLNISNNKITGEAADDITAAICCNTKLEELDVSENDLGTKGVEKIVIALQRIVTLTKLNISNNNVTYTAANAIAVAITHNTHLQEFIISGNYLGGELGAKIIAKGLQKISTLTKLYLANINNSDEATDDIAAAVSCNVHLQEFNIGKSYLHASSVIKVAKSLQKISTLTKLCINNNQITNEAAGYIANVISCNSHLQILDISSNSLQAQGATIILKKLQKISSLTTLYISNNNITYRKADDIAAVVSCNPMQVLDVSNTCLGTFGIRKVAKALQSVCTLTHLYISNNNIIDVTTDDIAAAISCNPYLEEFDISYNFIEGRGAIKIVKSFQQMSTLKKLFMDHNKISDGASDYVAAVTDCNRHLKLKI